MESLVSDIPSGDTKIANLFLQCSKGGGIRLSTEWVEDVSREQKSTVSKKSSLTLI